MKTEFIKLAQEYGMTLEQASAYYPLVKNPQGFLSLGLL